MKSERRNKNSSGLPFFQRCDSHFNPRSKVLLESMLAKSVVEDFYPLFAAAVKKVVDIIMPDLDKTLGQDREASSLSTALFHFLHQDAHLNQLIEARKLTPQMFSEQLAAKLRSPEAGSIYLHAVVIRLYLTFFITKGTAKPALNQAVQERWSVLDLAAVLKDTQSFRGDLFRNNVRLEKYGDSFMTDSSGILSENDPGYVPFGSLFSKALYTHDTGFKRYRITSRGDFTSDTMFRYNMPAICGPSGMVALYLALANQVSWTSGAEKQQYDFFMCCSTIYFGGHSLDECFSIGRGTYNRYVRGDYNSILDLDGLTENCLDTLRGIIDANKLIETMPCPNLNS